MTKIFIGVDFSKKTFDASVCTQECHEPSYIGKFSNDTDGFEALLAKVNELFEVGDAGDLLLCGENTGAYSTAFARYFAAGGCFVWLEHAARIKHSSGICRNKTDKADSRMIAEYALRFNDKAVRYVPDSRVMADLKTLFRYRSFLTREKVRLNNEIKSNNVLKDDGATMELVQSELKESLTETLRKIKEVEAKIKDKVTEDEEVEKNYAIITSVKGVAMVNAVNLIVCTDNFRKPENARQLMSYCGVAPFSHESGTSIHKPAKTGIQCRRATKALLNAAAKCAVIHNPKYKEYYQRLLARGKNFQIAINNVCAKLLREIFALVRDRLISDSATEVKQSKKACFSPQNACA